MRKLPVVSGKEVVLALCRAPAAIRERVQQPLESRIACIMRAIGK